MIFGNWRKINKRKIKHKLIFLLFFVVFIFSFPSILKADTGLMNGKLFTGETDNYLMWLQTRDSNYNYTDRFFIDKLGNVGLNTTTPSVKLDIDGGIGQVIDVSGGRIQGLNLIPLADSEAVPRKYLHDNFAPITGGVGSAFVQGGNSFGATAVLGTNDNQDLDFITDDTERMTIDADGNVGIGTTGPESNLHIVNDFDGGGSGTPPVNVLTLEANWNVNDPSLYLGTGPRLLFKIPHSGGSAIGAGITAIKENNLDGNSETGLAFSTSQNDETLDEVMRIKNNGNVGIGTTDPGYKLDVDGSGSFSNTVTVATPTSGSHATTRDYVDDALSSGTYWSANADDIYNNNSGNVGIGTTNPNAKLDIQGDDFIWSNQVKKQVAIRESVSEDSKHEVRIPWPSILSGPIILDVEVIIDTNSVGTKHYVKKRFYLSSYQNYEAGEIYYQKSYVIDSSAGSSSQYNYIGDFEEDTTAGEIVLPIYSKHNRQNSVVLTAWGNKNIAALISNSTYQSNVETGITPPTRASVQAPPDDDFIFNKNVGIDTGSPSYKLDVDGSARFTGTVSVATPTADSHAVTRSYLDSAISPITEGDYWKLGGNSLNSKEYIGSTSNYDIGFITDDTERMTIDADGNVGIGTTSPGSVGILEGLEIAGANRQLRLTDSDDGDFFQLSSSGDKLAFRYNEDLASNQNIMFMDGLTGNVGIGTTAPSVKLDVDGGTGQVVDVSGGRIQGLNLIPVADSEAVPRKYLHDNFAPITGGDGSAFVQGGNSFGTTAILGTNDTQDLAFETGGSTRMIVDTSGNIGIGTTNPGAKFEIYGNDAMIKLEASSSSGYNTVIANNYDTNNAFQISDSGVHNIIRARSDASRVYVGRDDLLTVAGASGNVGIGASNPETNLHLRGEAAGIDSITFAGGDLSTDWNNNALIKIDQGSTGGNAMAFSVSGTSNERKGYIQVGHTSGNFSNILGDLALNPFGGNVGIGTTSPAYKLDVNGQGYFSNTVSVATPTADPHATTKSYVDSAIDSGVASGVSGTTNYIPKFTDSNAIGNSVIYESGGNVGIGTIEPSSPLHVVKSDDGNLTVPLILQNQGSSGNSVGLFFSTNSVINDNSKAGIAANRSGSFGRADIHFLLRDMDDGISASLEDTKLIIKNNGNVGIGTTNPSYKLHVNGQGYFSNTVTVATPTADPHVATKSYVDSAASSGGQWTDDGTYIYANNANNVAITDNGNVGIGTTSPSSVLDIETALGADNTQLELRDSSVNVGFNFEIGDTDISGLATKNLVIRGDSTVSDMAFSPSSTYPGLMVLDGTSGNVGIGTTSPRAKLAVDGNLSVNQHNALNYTSYSHFAQPGLSTTFDNENIYDRADYDALSVGMRDTTLGANYLSAMKFLTYSGGTRGARILYAASGATGITSGLHFFVGSTSMTNIMTLTGGNVGIGTTSPSYKLDVNGTGRFTNTVTVATPTDGPHATTKDYVDSAVLNSTGLWSENGTDIYYNSGNVGIATSTPSTELDVGGIISANSVYTDTIGPRGSTITGGVGQSAAWSSITVSGTSTFATSEGRVGVGTSNPAYIFQVNSGVDSFIADSFGRIAVSTDVIDGHINAGSGRISNVATPINASDATTKSYVDSVAGAAIPTGTNGQTLYNSSGDWSASSNLFHNGTNVGIGTTAPSVKLDIDGGTGQVVDVSSGRIQGLNLIPVADSEAVPRKYLHDNFAPITGGDGSAFVQGGNSFGTTAVLGTNDNQDLAFETDGTTRMTLTDSGDVGIKTASPSTDLDVNGNASASIFYDRDNTNYYLDPAANVMSHSAIFAGNVGIGTTSPSYSLQVEGIIEGDDFYVDGNIGTILFKDNSDALIQTDNAAGASLSIYDRYNNNKIATFKEGGNVGIGTTNPGAKLDVDGGLGIRISNDEYATITQGSFTDGLGVSVGSADVAMRTRHSGTEGSNNVNQVWFNNGGTAIFQGGTERFRVHTDGNVGIGTTAPTYKLDVNGSGYFANNLTVATPTDGPHAATKDYVDNALTSGTFWAANGDDIYNSNSGNVGIGIGTTAPGSLLSIANDNWVTALNNDDTGYVNMFKVNSNNQLELGTAINAGTFEFAPDSGFNTFADMAVTSDPAVGTVEGYSMKIDGNNILSLYSEADGSGGIQNEGVGIGTSNPLEKLHVVGNVRVSGTLATQTGSDFAEEFVVSDYIEPASVVVMGDLGYKSVKESSEAFDSSVVGVVSDNPSIVAGKVDSDNKAIVAMVGVVSVKVVDEGGNIKRGDLLTSSSVPGYAMKADKYVGGTIIGKALEDLEGEKGMVKVLVNLQ